MSAFEATGFLLFLSLFSGLIENSDALNDCKDVSTLLLIDWTNNVKEEEKNEMISLSKRLTAVQDDDSDTSFSLVAEGNTNVQSLDDVLDVPSSHSNKVSASAIETAISAGFPFNHYPTKAEIVYILTTDRTTLDVPSVVLKKKTFVIVFGTSITSSVREIATIGNHVYLIKHNEDIVKVVKKIHQQTCIDSHFLCDVDQHKDNTRSSTCVKCLDICSEKQIRAEKCSSCPYMRLPPKVQEIKHGPTSDVNEPVRYVKDNKDYFIISILLSLAMIFIAIVIFSSVYACYRKRVACFARQTEDRRTEDRAFDLPESIAVHDVGHETIPQEILSQNDRLLPPNIHPGNQPDVGGIDGTDCQGQRYFNIRHSESACGIQDTTV